MADNIKNNIERINETNFLLKTMLLNTGMVTMARTNSGDPILSCDYMCSLKYQLNTHKISKHGVLVKPLKIAAFKRKSPPNKSPEIKRKSKGMMIESKNDSSQSKEDTSTKSFTCTKCAFIYNTENDLMQQMSAMHAQIADKKQDSKPEQNVGVLGDQDSKQKRTIKPEEKKEQEHIHPSEKLDNVEPIAITTK